MSVIVSNNIDIPNLISIDLNENSVSQKEIVVNKRFKVLHQNIRSMRKNLCTFLANVETMNNCPSMMFLTEIWIYENELSLYNLNGYNLHANCNETMEAGGVALYIKNDLQYNMIALNLTSADCLRVDLEVNGEILVFICIYRLHGVNKKTFLSELKHLTRSIKSSNLCILGDINLDILVENNEVDEYVLEMAYNGLECLINEPTRIFNDSVSCIDHVFYRSRKQFSLSTAFTSLLQFDVSDHHCIMIEFTGSEKVIPKVVAPTSKNVIDYCKLNLLLLTDTWQDVYSSQNASDAFDNFLSILLNLIDQSSINKHIKSKQRKLKEWMSNDLLNLVNKKRKAESKCRKHPNNERLKCHHRSLVKKVQFRVKECKELYYKQKLSDCAGNSKKQWNVINDILGNNSAQSKIESILDTNGSKLTNMKDIANRFNHHFVNITSGLSDTLNCNNIDLSDLVVHRNEQSSIFLTPVSNNELLKTIFSLDNKTSAGIDGISNFFVKNVAQHISPVLCYIYNLSLETGIFPKALKSAVVIPLFKKGNRDDPSNYRPISLLPVFSKIFEKLVKSRAMSFLKKTGFLSKTQFGFLEGTGTEDAINRLLSAVYEGINVNHDVAALFIDIAKAFDLVDHKILLRKLLAAGFRGKAHDWFSSFLSNRTQVIRVNGCLSESCELIKGVPQGSVLGPILFLIYINSLLELKFHGGITAFADDTAFIYKTTSHSETIVQINDDLKLLRKWFDANNLTLSDKSKLMKFRLAGNYLHSLSGSVIYHNGNCNGRNCSTCVSLEFVEEFKYLGIIIDRKLSWKKHIQKLKSELCFSLRQLYQLKKICNINLLRVIYFALVQSKLEYGISFWGGTYASALKPIFIAQKHIIRVINNKNRREHSMPLFRLMNILPLRYLYIYKTLKIFFLKSGNNNFIREPPGGLRLRYHCTVPKIRKEIFRKSFIVSAPSIFNKLPYNLRCIISNRQRFVKTLFSWLLSQIEVEYLLTYSA